jgi:hypothetical protein
MTRLAVPNWDESSPIIVPEGFDVPSQGVDLWTGRQVRVRESTAMGPRSVYLLTALERTGAESCRDAAYMLASTRSASVRRR